MNIGDILGMYARGADRPPADAPDHFEQAANAVPAEDVSHGLASAFRSERTPPFADMLAGLFERSNPQQRSGVLSQILQSLGPSVANATGGGMLGNILSRFPSGQVPADYASDVRPDQVRDIAAEAEKHNPGVIDAVSRFYAQHPGLVKTLGTAAMGIALSHMAQRRGL